MKFCKPKLICSLCYKTTLHMIGNEIITCKLCQGSNPESYEWLTYYFFHKNTKVFEIRYNQNFYDIENKKINYTNLYSGTCIYNVNYKFSPILSQKSFNKITDKLNLYFEKLELLQ